MLSKPINHPFIYVVTYVCQMQFKCHVCQINPKKKKKMPCLSLSFFLFSWFLYKSINNKRIFVFLFFFLLLNKEKSINCTVKLTAETLFQYATVPTPKYHLLISDQITSHYCVVRLLINAFQPDQLPIHLCLMQFLPFPPRCKPVTARGGLT